MTYMANKTSNILSDLVSYIFNLPNYIIQL